MCLHFVALFFETTSISFVPFKFHAHTHSIIMNACTSHYSFFELGFAFFFVVVYPNLYRSIFRITFALVAVVIKTKCKKKYHSYQFHNFRAHCAFLLLCAYCFGKMAFFNCCTSAIWIVSGLWKNERRKKINRITNTQV